ncbi:RNA-directed DNA polymerase, eukaryota, reverse transcriptase zinc-binding domain protein, partial [Tanacetum coccineum]
VELKLDNTELERIPLWVRLCNIPVEAWTVKGDSALASRIGKPLIMDDVTASKCKNGVGLVRFARFLIEVNAKKEMVDNIKVVYKCSEGIVQCRKNIKVLYDWKPLVCIKCGVFRHAGSNCPKSVKSVSNSNEKREEVAQNQNIDTGKEDKESFIEVKSRKNGGIDNKVKKAKF